MKVRVTIPLLYWEILENDIERFKITKNRFMNLLFEKYPEPYLEKDKIKTNKIESHLVQFDLTNLNEEVYKNKFSEISPSNYFKQLIRLYIEYLPKEREEILFSEIVKKLESAISKNRKVILYFDKKKVKVEPFFIKFYPSNNRNYLFGYNYNRKREFVIKLSIIRGVELCSKIEKREKYEKEHVNKVYKYFDPFLSYDSRVKIRMTNKAKEKYNNLRTYRPRIIEKESEDIWIFQANQIFVERYFYGFLDEIEILEPKEIRENYCEKLKKAYLENM